MLKSLEGVYRNGKVELREKTRPRGECSVIVTFLPPVKTAPKAPKLSRKETAELRAKLAAWDEDWSAPGMEAYDAI